MTEINHNHNDENDWYTVSTLFLSNVFTFTRNSSVFVRARRKHGFYYDMILTQAEINHTFDQNAFKKKS